MFIILSLTKLIHKKSAYNGSIMGLLAEFLFFNFRTQAAFIKPHPDGLKHQSLHSSVPRKKSGKYSVVHTTDFIVKQAHIGSPLNN